MTRTRPVKLVVTRTPGAKIGAEGVVIYRKFHGKTEQLAFCAKLPCTVKDDNEGRAGKVGYAALAVNRDLNGKTTEILAKSNVVVVTFVGKRGPSKLTLKIGGATCVAEIAVGTPECTGLNSSGELHVPRGREEVDAGFDDLVTEPRQGRMEVRGPQTAIVERRIERMPDGADDAHHHRLTAAASRR